MTEQKAGLKGHSYDVTVVCGVIEYGGKILIGMQVEGEHPADLGGKWHFPGGRVEQGEAIEQALRREVKEETNLHVDIREQLGQRVDTRRARAVRLLYFRCTPTTHDFTAIASDDLQEVKWTEKHQVLQSLDEGYARTLPAGVIAFFESGS
jgi:ADP-ribose pyrophosphatase YjhB (NUDIX family)